ncbi:MAG: hypothetical protein EHM79_00290 [Geobacter sp.]|nr:MAG: hypothetical protein EHM79_00290 [Geobacter sp.]
MAVEVHYKIVRRGIPMEYKETLQVVKHCKHSVRYEGENLTIYLPKLVMGADRPDTITVVITGAPNKKEKEDA